MSERFFGQWCRRNGDQFQDRHGELVCLMEDRSRVVWDRENEEISIQNRHTKIP